MFIYKLGVVLYTSIIRDAETHDYFDMYLYKYEAKEKAKTYEFYDESNLRKLKKEKLNQFDSKFLDNLYSGVGYFVYSKEEDIEMNKERLMDKLKVELDKRKLAHDRLVAQFNKGFEFDERDYTK